MSRRPRRPPHEIYCEILETIQSRGSCNITRISYSANLPVDRAKKAVEHLVDNGFLREEIREPNREYGITQKGWELLHALRTVTKYLGGQ